MSSPKGLKSASSYFNKAANAGSVFDELVVNPTIPNVQTSVQTPLSSHSTPTTYNSIPLTSPLTPTIFASDEQILLDDSSAARVTEPAGFPQNPYVGTSTLGTTIPDTDLGGPSLIDGSGNPGMSESIVSDISLDLKTMTIAEDPPVPVTSVVERPTFISLPSSSELGSSIAPPVLSAGMIYSRFFFQSLHVYLIFLMDNQVSCIH